MPLKSINQILIKVNVKICTKIYHIKLKVSFNSLLNLEVYKMNKDWKLFPKSE